MLFKNINSLKKGNILVNKTKNSNILVLYYANWCGHCISFKPIWETIHKHINSRNICDVAEIESEELKYVKPLRTHYNGFPTLVLYKKSELLQPKKTGLINSFFDKYSQQNTSSLPKNAINYSGARTFNDILKFVKQNIPSTNIPKTNRKLKLIDGSKTKYKKTNNPIKPKLTLKNTKQTNTYNRSPEFYTNKEVLKMKKDRKKSQLVVSKLKKELNDTFKV